MNKFYTTLSLIAIGFAAFAQNPAGNAFRIDYDQFQAGGGVKYFNCGTDGMLNVGDELTLEVWVQLRDYGDNQKLIGKFGLNSTGYLLGVDQGKIYPEVWNPTYYEDLAGLMNPLAQHWQHLAVTYQRNDSLRSYINGVQVGAINVSDAPLATNSDPLIIGIASWDLANFQTFGNIDEVRIWDVERTVDDIRADMFRHADAGAAGLVAYYDFNQSTGSALPDVTGNGNDGTGSNVDADEWVASNAVLANAATENSMDLHGLWNGISFQDPRVASTDNGMTLTGSAMDTADYAVFGHDGGMGIATADVAANAPANFTRTTRVWDMTVMGTINANVLINLADAANGGTSLNTGAQASFYTLLHRAGTSGEFAPVAMGASVNNGVVSFNGVELMDGQYAIGVGDSEYGGVGIFSNEIQEITVYPNPSNGEYFVDLSAILGSATLEVFATNGSRIMSKQVTSADRTIDLSDFGSGMYQLRITADEAVFGQRVIVR